MQKLTVTIAFFIAIVATPLAAFAECHTVTLDSTPHVVCTPDTPDPSQTTGECGSLWGFSRGICEADAQKRKAQQAQQEQELREQQIEKLRLENETARRALDKKQQEPEQPAAQSDQPQAPQTQPNRPFRVNSNILVTRIKAGRYITSGGRIIEATGCAEAADKSSVFLRYDPEGPKSANTLEFPSGTKCGVDYILF